MITVRTIDLETSDWPANGGKVLEGGYVDTHLEKGASGWWEPVCKVYCAKQQFFDPQGPISHGARATHHITDEQLTGAPPHTLLNEWITEGNPDIYIAHNAEFEMNYVKIPDGKFWIDTYKVALRMLPDDDHHNNQYLRYRLGLVYDLHRIALHEGPPTP